MNQAESTFFGLIVNPNFDYKTLLKDDLLITNAVIDPEAAPEHTSRLLLKVDNKRVPLCQLDGRNVTCTSLNISLLSGAEIVFNVSGDCPIHVTGFYSPPNEIETPTFIPTGYDLSEGMNSNQK